MATTVSPRAIGACYLGIALLAGIVGTVASNIMRMEGATSGQIVVHNSSSTLATYNLLITVHGLVMVFWFIMPTLFGGMGNVVLPLSLGVSDVAYPRLNSLSLLILPLSLSLVIVGIVQEYITGTGWTLYAPLSTEGSIWCYAGISLVLLGLIIVGVSSTLTSINFTITAFLVKTSGTLVEDSGLCTLCMVVTSVLLLLVLPVLLCLLLFTLQDITLNTSLFDATFGGDPLLFQHLFWVFGHPEVYIIILPGFGIVSMLVVL